MEKIIVISDDGSEVAWEHDLRLIYKIVTRESWSQAEHAGVFHGAPVDRADGYIHFSAADQVAETAAKHFAGGSDLLLVAVPADKLGHALRWEPSRGGALFPHLYGALELTHVEWARPLQSDAEGRHDFSGLFR